MTDIHALKSPLTVPLDFVSLRLVSNNYRNALLIANNPNMSPDIAGKLDISEADILVQFNKALFFQSFAATLCHKVMVFNANAEGSYWGFTKDGEPATDYLAQAATEMSFYFTSGLSGPAKAYLAALIGKASGGILERSWQPRPYAYPQGAMSSVGFKAVHYFKTINSLRLQCNKPPIKLVLVGFAGKPSPKAAWGRHDFEFEQKTYDTWLELVRLDTDGKPQDGAR